VQQMINYHPACPTFTSIEGGKRQRIQMQTISVIEPDLDSQRVGQ